MCETLSRMLLGAVREEIRGKRVVVVPDGALAYVPFDALFSSPRAAVVVHHGLAPQILAHRQLVLDAAYSAHAEMFFNRLGRHPRREVVEAPAWVPLRVQPGQARSG